MSTTTALYTFNGVPDVLARSVTTTITGATFSDGAVLSGSWTANYDSAGNLLDQVSGTFTVTGPAGTATFSVAGTLPYANQASDTSYEIHFLARSGTGYDSLYVDWQGETPGALASGTASLYTSVRGTDSSQPLRLSSCGSVSQGATCFLAGTRLLTPSGAVAVESLRVGEAVSVLRDGVLVAETVRWIGSRTVVRSDNIVPVRIRADAFAAGLPHADLLVTPEHCILVDGGLIPARMLVNGRSIVEDHSLPSFSFHHVELDRHGILLAENLPTESYLDTGNRSTFAQNDVVALAPDLAIDATSSAWDRDSCAPLTTDRDTVEPIWRRLDQRAATLGLGAAPSAPERVDDPALRLLLDTGVTLCPHRAEAGDFMFAVPRGAAPIALLSRSVRPSDLIGPFLDDRRELGVKIAALLYGEGSGAVRVAPDTLAPVGWHAPEADGRWTDGAAGLTLSAAGSDRVTLTACVVATLRYPMEPAGQAASYRPRAA